MRLTLKDDGFPFKKIMQGRRWIGRVARMGDGSGYIARIGSVEHKAATERQAFEEAGARYMGHASAATLHGQNRRVRQAQKMLRSVGDHVASEMLRGNYEPFDKIMRAPAPVADAAVSATFRSVTRKLLR